MDTNKIYHSAARLIPVAAASTLITVFGCVPTGPVITPPSTKPDSQYFGSAETASGDVYVTGYVNFPVGASNYYASSFVLRKFDAKQKFLWERQYPDPSQSEYLTAIATSLPTDNAGKFVQLASDGSVYVAATLQKPSNYGKAHADVDYDVVLLKYSASGDLLWTRNIDLLKKDFPRDLQLDAAGNVYLQGRTIKSTTPAIPEVRPAIDYFNDFVASFKSNGDLRWRVDFDKQGENATGNMQFQSDGFYLTALIGSDGCGNLYKIDYAGHIAPASPNPLPVCPDLATIIGDHVVFTPATASGDENSLIFALNNLSSVETTIAWNDIALSSLHADDGFTSVRYEVVDRRQPNSFFALIEGSYQVNGPEAPEEIATQLVHVNSTGNLLSIVPITNADGSPAGFLGDVKLTQTASGDVIVSTYLEDPTGLGGSDFYVVNYNSHAVVHYSLAPHSLLSSFTDPGAGQPRLVVGSQFVNEIWTPVIRRFEQAQ